MIRKKKTERLSAVLSNFWEQLFPMVQDSYVIPKILERIEFWVGEDPVLTEALCSYVVEHASEGNETGSADVVDRVVQICILYDWLEFFVASHIIRISDDIEQTGHKDIILLLYLQILQRGSMTAEKSTAQEALIASGLVVKKGRKLLSANRLYAQVCDSNWIESQLPGITRPVTIIKAQPEGTNRRPSLSSGVYSKLAVSACCLAVIGAGISAYLREAGNQAAMATQESQTELQTLISGTEVTSAENSTPELSDSQVQAPESAVNAAAPVATPSDRERFDEGVEHATNGRWLLMAREFCSLPQDGTYHKTAENQLEKWVKLYREDIEIS